MNWITGVGVVGLILLLWGLSEGEWSGEGRKVIGSVLIGLAILVGGITAIDVYMGFEPEMAKLTEVRKAVERLGCSASEDVIGKATDWNVDLASAKLWNKRWIADPFYNDGIDTVTMIVIPNCK